MNKLQCQHYNLNKTMLFIFIKNKKNGRLQFVNDHLSIVIEIS